MVILLMIRLNTPVINSKINDAHCRLILPSFTQINQVLSLIQNSYIICYALSKETVHKPNKTNKNKIYSPWDPPFSGDRYTYTSVIGFCIVPMKKAPIPTEMSKGQSDNTNNATKKVRLRWFQCRAFNG